MTNQRTKIEPTIRIVGLDRDSGQSWQKRMHHKLVKMGVQSPWMAVPTTNMVSLDTDQIVVGEILSLIHNTGDETIAVRGGISLGDPKQHEAGLAHHLDKSVTVRNIHPKSRYRLGRSIQVVGYPYNLVEKSYAERAQSVIDALTGFMPEDHKYSDRSYILPDDTQWPL